MDRTILLAALAWGVLHVASAGSIRAQEDLRPGVVWKDDYSKALTLAKQLKKPLFMEFESSG